MNWNIVTDSSCDHLPVEDNNIRVADIPFVIQVDDKDYVDAPEMNTLEMLDAMESAKTPARTACPSPEAWLSEFRKAGKTIALTISANLSGCFGSAMLARNMALEEDPTREIAIVDSCSTGPEMVLCTRHIRKLIEEKRPFETIVREANRFFLEHHIIFALSSFDNLIKNGRMNRLAGTLAKKLGMWGIGIGSDEGTIKIKGTARGEKGAVRNMIDYMKSHDFNGGTVAISHCHNLPVANLLRDRIKEMWEKSEVLVMPTRGLTSFYAERGGIILAF
ncbi:MAG: DegV family EDD domain-containing protein [Clostridia bacterium]|nr:DegV family EDD domain-containing protein [Clostridia bacterium]